MGWSVAHNEVAWTINEVAESDGARNLRAHAVKAQPTPSRRVCSPTTFRPQCPAFLPVVSERVASYIFTLCTYDNVSSILQQLHGSAMSLYTFHKPQDGTQSSAST